MPAITGAFIAGIARLILSSLGIGIVSFIGVEALLNTAMGLITSGLSSSSQVAGFAGLMGVDRAISLVISGYSIRVSLAALRRFRLL